ncbi:hypothetical protein ACQP3L_35835, partial [Escherichia coli]
DGEFMTRCYLLPQVKPCSDIRTRKTKGRGKYGQHTTDKPLLYHRTFTHTGNASGMKEENLMPEFILQ